jgi:acetoin utilization protein AcuB
MVWKRGVKEIMLVGNHMTQNVLTVQLHTPHRDALDLMRTRKIRRLPVMDGDRLVGIISEKDLLSTAPSPATSLSVYEIYTLLDKLTMDKIMTHPVVTVGPDCPLQDAAQIMIERRIGCLPVMVSGKLVGIITETDIMRALVRVLGGGISGMNVVVRIKDEPGALAAVCNAVAQAGGNIVAITATAHNATPGEIAIKEQGANEDKLRANLIGVGAEILDFQHAEPHIPQLYG